VHLTCSVLKTVAIVFARIERSVNLSTYGGRVLLLKPDQLLGTVYLNISETHTITFTGTSTNSARSSTGARIRLLRRQ